MQIYGNFNYLIKNYYKDTNYLKLLKLNLKMKIDL